MGNMFTPAERDDRSPATAGTDHDTTVNALGANAPGQHRELAHRSTDGLEVTLVWRPITDELAVRVWDQRQHVRFEIRPDRHTALEVYYHPYAYLGSGAVQDALAV